MKLWVDAASPDEIAEWAAHPWVSGFTTNPSLMVGLTGLNPGGGMAWAQDAVEAANGKPISIDGPPEVWDLGPNVYRKVTDPTRTNFQGWRNLTAVCSVRQADVELLDGDIISVFCGRIMDTGRDPQPVIDAARATGAQVLWASVREPYNITQAEQMGCDIITVPPAILRKYLEWNAMPLETVAELTIAQFDKDREGLWT